MSPALAPRPLPQSQSRAIKEFEMRNLRGRARALLLAALVILALTIQAGAPVLAEGLDGSGADAAIDDLSSMPWPM